MARHALVKNIFGQHLKLLPRLPFGPRAKVDVLRVAQALETPGGAVTAEGLLGTPEVQVYDTFRPLVELGAFVS
jgi:hypothetical protein